MPEAPIAAIRCTRCNARIPPGRDEATPVACVRCGKAVVTAAPPPAPPAIERPPLREPGFSTFQRIRHAPVVVGDAPFRSTSIAVRDDLVIEWPWAHNRERHLVFAAVVPVAVAALAAELGTEAVAAIGFVLAVLAALYLAICVFFERSRLTVTADIVELTHGPLPVPAGWRLRADQIEPRELPGGGRE